MIAAAGLCALASPAIAQVAVGGSVEIATDERRRGISWSDGKVAPAASVRASVPFGLDLGVRATGTRGDPRHGGADAVFDVTGGFTRDIGGGLRLDEDPEFDQTQFGLESNESTQKPAARR